MCSEYKNKPASAWRSFFWKHEHIFAFVYIIIVSFVALASFLLILFNPPFRIADSLCSKILGHKYQAFSERYDHAIKDFNKGETKDAISSLESLLDDLPKRSRTQIDGRFRVKTLLMLAWLYKNTGDKKAAINSFERLITFDPGVAQYEAYYGAMLSEFAEDALAETQLKKALDTDPSNTMATELLIAYYFRVGRYSDVIRVYQDYIASFSMSLYVDYSAVHYGVFLGDSRDKTVAGIFRFPMVVDGKLHSAHIPLHRKPNLSTELKLDTVLLRLRLPDNCGYIEFPSVKLLGRRNLKDLSSTNNPLQTIAAYTKDYTNNFDMALTSCEGMTPAESPVSFSVNRGGVDYRLLLKDPVKACDVDEFEIEWIAKKRISANILTMVEKSRLYADK